MSIPLWVDVEYRTDIGTWLNDHGLTGAAAEVGCLHGEFARQVLNRWKGFRYFMIDVWQAQDKEVYKERTEGTDYEACYRDCQALAAQDDRVRLIRKMSLDAAQDIEDGSLDMAYIDANHAYGPSLLDMDAYWAKVRIGGIMGVHDYKNETHWPNWIEVKAAVDRWCSERRIVFVYSRCTSVWMVKHP